MPSLSISQAKPKALIYRADGSAEYGMGHIYRGIAIAEIFKKENIEVIFLVKNFFGIKDLISKHNFKCYEINQNLNFQDDANRSINIAKKLKIDFFIFDLNHIYSLSNKKKFIEYLNLFKKNNYFSVLIDGMGQECLSTTHKIHCNVIVMPYLNADLYEYKKFKTTRILAGLEYLPLRNIFLKSNVKLKKRTSGLNVLVCFGGGDVLQFNNKILQALFLTYESGLNIKIIGNISNFDYANIEIEVLKNQNNIVKFMRWADLIIIGSGLTRYEASFLGVPALIFSTRKMHLGMILDFVKYGSALYLGDINLMSVKKISKSFSKIFLDKKLLSKLSSNGRRLFKNYCRLSLANQLLSEYSVHKSKNHKIDSIGV